MMQVCSPISKATTIKKKKKVNLHQQKLKLKTQKMYEKFRIDIDITSQNPPVT